MNVFHKVTLASLRKNRVRTMVTIIGVMLSAAMICAVTAFTSSFQNYMLENMIYVYGSWHGSASDIDRQTRMEIQADPRVEEAVYAQQLGYVQLTGCDNPDKPYLYVIGTGPGFEDTMPVHLVSGHYPASAEQILLPQHLADNGGIHYQTGDTVTLELGERVSDDFCLGQANPYVGEGEAAETLRVRETRTYTVCGFYERPSFEDYSAPGYTAVTLADNTADAGFRYDVYFRMQEPKDVYAYMQELGQSGTVNTDVLMFQGVSSYTNFYRVLYNLAAVVILLILVGSVSLIYNAFAISVSERTRQFGLLASVGATRRQLRRSVLFEAAVVSAVGIPMGILVGICGIGITLRIIGSRFSSVLGYPVVLRLYVSPMAVLIACLVAMVTVFISAYIPSARAAKVTAMEAIRQSRDIRVPGRPGRTWHLTQKVFGLPGILAGKYYRRSRKKYRATVLSLVMSMVLFVSASVFSEYLMESAQGSFGAEQYDLSLWQEMSLESAEPLLAQLKEDASVTDGVYLTAQSGVCTIRADLLTEEGLARQPFDEWESIVLQEGEALLFVSCIFVDEEAFRALLRQNQLSEELFMDPQVPVAVAIDTITHMDYDAQMYVSPQFLSQDKVSVRWQERTLQTGARLAKVPYYMKAYRSDVIFVYPISAMAAVMPEQDPENLFFEFYFLSADHSASCAAIKETLAENGYGSSSLYDLAGDLENNRNFVLILQVFSYGFIVLISLIAAANVFNTISTNIHLRRREFAMLRSVGMTKGGFNRMMAYECLLYGTRTLLYGLPLSMIFTFLIFRSISAGYATAFHLPWAAVGIAVFSVFAVVFATMMYAMRKIQKEDLVEALKNENV